VNERGERKTRTGVVVSDGMEKTVVVQVESRKPHRLYEKMVRRMSKLHAHDEANEAKVGDVVRLMETRPLSKTKRWRIVEIVEKAK
jgi:small subunit ribosomal protein S17